MLIFVGEVFESNWKRHLVHFAKYILILGIWGIAATASAQDNPYALVAELVASHRDSEALEAFDALGQEVRDRADGRLLRARLLERLGQIGEALDTMPTGAQLESLPRDVRRMIRIRRARLLRREGRCEEAEALQARLSPTALAEAEAAQCALRSGDLGTAIEGFRRVLRRRARSVDRFAARIQLAEALIRQENLDEGLSEIVLALTERPEHPEAEQAQRHYTALRGEPIAWTPAQRLNRAERLHRVRRHRDALEELADLAPLRDREQRRRLMHLRGMALYRARDAYAEAAQVLEASSRLGGPWAREDQFHAARALSRADQDRAAVAEYRRFAREHARHERAPEALYLAAWLELRHGFRGGLQHMTEFVRSAAARRSPRFRTSAIWQLGLHAFKRRRYSQAARYFLRSVGRSTRPLIRSRGLYWTGRAHEMDGDRTRAVTHYRRALHAEPLHWYALLARQRLLDLDVDPGRPFSEIPLPEEQSDPPDVSWPEEVGFYARLGFREDAVQMLRERERVVRAAAGSHGLRVLCEAYRDLGEASRPLQLLGGATTLQRAHAPGPADQWRWSAAFPRPFPELAQTVTRANGLEPAYIYALIRQESGFDANAVSYADAIGLMQLLPSTATRVGEELGVAVHRDMLFEPAWNLRFGATLIGTLVQRFGVPLAFAGYNAGGHRVEEWLSTEESQPLDLLVEEIPFNQTRNYIRRVTSHFAHYLYLQNPSAGWPFRLPLRVGGGRMATARFPDGDDDDAEE